MWVQMDAQELNLTIKGTNRLGSTSNTIKFLVGVSFRCVVDFALATMTSIAETVCVWSWLGLLQVQQPPRKLTYEPEVPSDLSQSALHRSSPTFTPDTR